MHDLRYATRPSEYDNRNAGTVVRRIRKAMDNLWSHEARSIAEDYITKDQQRDNDCTPNGEHLPADWQFYAGTPSQVVLSIEKLCNVTRHIKQYARAIGNALRGKKNAETKARINSATQQSEHEFFRYLRDRCAPPAGALWDPVNKKHVFDTNEQHKLMIQQWRTVFDVHKGSPPSWEDFINKYGQYHGRDDNCPKGIPSAAQLHARAKRAANDSAPGLDGWRPRELKLLPYDAWVKRELVLRLAAKLGRFPESYRTVNTPALPKKGKGKAPLDHR